MNDDFYLKNNRIGKLFSSLERLNAVGIDTHTRLTWFRFAFAEYEQAQEINIEIEPELFSRFASMLIEVKSCRDIVRGFNRYSPRLYENAFSEIYLILRNSWENTGHPWQNFANQLMPHMTSLEHICEKASIEIGYAKLPSESDIEEFTNDILAFESKIEQSDYDEELKSRLLKCAKHARRSLEDFLATSENNFWQCFEEIWKEVMFYIANGKSGDIASRKSEVSNSGVDKILTRMNVFLAIINTGNALIANENTNNLLQQILK